MAFLIKNARTSAGAGPSRGNVSVVDQGIHVVSPSKTVPQSTTQQIFRVYGGRVLVKKLVGEVTTVIQSQADNLKVSSKRLDNAAAAVGTAVDIAANVDITGLEVGGNYFVEGDGTAGVLSNAGGVLGGSASGQFIAPQGEIYLTASASNTGAMKWDLWYQPLDEGAYVEGVVSNVAAI